MHLIGVLVAPAPPAAQLPVDVGSSAEARLDRIGEALGLAQGIGDSLRGRGVLEVPGVAQERPPRPRRLAEVAVPVGHHPYRAGPGRPVQQPGQLGPGGDPRHEAALATGEKGVLGRQRRADRGHEEPGVGRAGDVGQVPHRSEPQVAFGFGRSLEVGPGEQPRGRRHVVLAGAGRAGHGGAPAVGPDHQASMKRAGLGLNSATRFPSQSRPLARVCVRTSAPAAAAASTSRRSRAIRRRHSAGAPNAPVDRGGYARPAGDEREARQRRRPRRPSGVQHPESLEDGDPAGLDHVGREGLAGKSGLVQKADPQSTPGKHRRQRRAGAAGSHDHHVEMLSVDPRPVDARNGRSREWTCRLPPG